MIDIVEPVRSEMFETCDYCSGPIGEHPMRLLLSSAAAWHAGDSTAEVYATEHVYHKLPNSTLERRALVGIVNRRASLAQVAFEYAAGLVKAKHLEAAQRYVARGAGYLEEAQHPELLLRKEDPSGANATDPAQSEPALPGDGQAAAPNADGIECHGSSH